jgi:hypothetical protein
MFVASQTTHEKEEHPDVPDPKGTRRHLGALSLMGGRDGLSRKGYSELQLVRLTMATIAEGFIAIEQKMTGEWLAAFLRVMRIRTAVHLARRRLLCGEA